MKLVKKKKSLKLVSLISLVSFSLISTISGTVAWFWAKKDIDSAADSMTIINDESLDYELRVLKFDQNEKKGIESKIGSDFNFELSEYDSYIDEHNKYLSQIIEVKIKTTQTHALGGALDIVIPCSGDFSFVENSTNYVNAVMSNCIKFKVLKYSHTLNDSTTPVPQFTLENTNRYLKELDPDSTVTYLGDVNDRLYQELRYQFENYEYTTYVPEATISSFKGTSYSSKLPSVQKQTSVTLSVKLADGSTKVLPENFKEAIFYIQYDYSKILTEFFATDRKSTLSLSESNQISLNADFTSLNFKYKEN